jgi:hypothetical protein
LKRHEGYCWYFGIAEKEGDSTLELLPEIGSEGVLTFPAMEVSQSLLEKHSLNCIALERSVPVEPSQTRVDACGCWKTLLRQNGKNKIAPGMRSKRSTRISRHFGEVSLKFRVFSTKTDFFNSHAYYHQQWLAYPA